jgi:hypothetical protein
VVADLADRAGAEPAASAAAMQKPIARAASTAPFSSVSRLSLACSAPRGRRCRGRGGDRRRRPAGPAPRRSRAWCRSSRRCGRSAPALKHDDRVLLQVALGWGGLRGGKHGGEQRLGHRLRPVAARHAPVEQQGKCLRQASGRGEGQVPKRASTRWRGSLMQLPPKYRRPHSARRPPAPGSAGHPRQAGSQLNTSPERSIGTKEARRAGRATSAIFSGSSPARNGPSGWGGSG